MKKPFLFWLAFLLCFSIANAAESFRPNTVEAMTVEAQIVANIELQGTPSAQDWMEVKMLSFQDSETQTVEEIVEELRSGNRVFFPETRTENENRYAIFTVRSLGGLGPNPSFELRIRARIKTKGRIGLNRDYNLSRPIQEKNAFLLPSHYIESGSPTLKSKAALEFKSDSELETVREITEWVNSNIEYDFEKYYGKVYSAMETYQNRAGVCDEFANLTAAFLRIKGIPARYVSGISFDGNRFGNHGWIEAFLPNTGWIGVDSTYGEAGYLDGAHIALGKGLDNSELQNILVSMHTANPSGIRIVSSIREPQVEIKETRFLENLSKTELKKMGKVGLNQPFEIRATIENKLEKNVLLPVTLSLHPDFLLPTKNRVVWLGPFEKKELVWKAVSPSKGQEGYYTNYEARLQTPDQTIEETVSVYPDLFQEPGEKQLVIEDISPFVSNQTLQLNITISNPSEKDQNLEFEFRQNNRTESFSKTIPATTKKMEQFVFMNVVSGEMELRVSGALQKTYRIQIPAPESTSEKPIITEKPIQPGNEPVSQPSWLDSILLFFRQLFTGIGQLFRGP